MAPDDASPAPARVTATQERYRLGPPAPAPGRYCLRVCYCGSCPQYVPLPPLAPTPPPPWWAAAREPGATEHPP
jgi:hypothetical protein